MPLAWRTRSHDNGLLGALETVPTPLVFAIFWR